jgi:hypothetical protein
VSAHSFFISDNAGILFVLTNTLTN